MDIGSLLPRHARYRAAHPALIVGGNDADYRALNAYVNRLANALLAAGLRKGDKFATVLPELPGDDGRPTGRQRRPAASSCR